jgi:hypothetical protein
MFTFPSIPRPSKEEWDHLEPESLCHNILELCTVYASANVKTEWDMHIGDTLVASGEEGVMGSAEHVQIRATSNKKPIVEPPPRRNIHYVNIPSKRLLDKVDQDRKMTVAELRAALWSR